MENLLPVLIDQEESNGALEDSDFYSVWNFGP